MDSPTRQQGEPHPSLARRVDNRSRGFTLPELLVATACSLAIMAIIAVCFQKAIDAFRTLRAVASMQDKLKSAENVIKRDLASEHFSGIFRPGYGGPFLRDQRLDLTGWYPPDEGCFSINTVAGYNEGNDSDGLPSFYAPQGSLLQFTIKLSGKRDEDYCRAVPYNPLIASGASNANPPDFNPAGQFVSRWAEVAYFLAAPPSPATQQYANGTPLYNLYRRQRVALSPETIATVAAAGGTVSRSVGTGNATLNTYPDISISPSTGNVNISSDLTVAANRLFQTGSANPTAPSGLTGTYQGDDILLTNVISFDVSCNWSNGNAAGTPTFPAPSVTSDWPFPQTTALTFDTGTRQGTNATINWDDPSSYLSATISGATGRGTCHLRESGSMRSKSASASGTAAPKPPAVDDCARCVRVVARSESRGLLPA